MKHSIISLLSAVALLVCSCATSRQVPYFQDAADGHSSQLASDGRIRLRPDDKISIVLKSHETNLTSLFNFPYVSQRIGTPEEMNLNYTTGIVGFVIDQDGYIDYPVLGKVKAAGLTRSELAHYIQDSLIENNLVADPIVSVDFMNLYVSVMGEVNRPGRVSIDHDEYTILDALSAAGDLTISGLRKNVRVIRNEDGIQKTYVLNLCSAEELASSPVYFLRQNDVVYVEPNKMKTRQSTVNGNNVLSTSFWISLSSLAVTTLVAINQFNR